MENVFKIKGFRKSQRMVANDIARNLIKNVVTSNTSDGMIYGKNGKIRGWVIGSFRQLSKRKPWGMNNSKVTFGFQK